MNISTRGRLWHLAASGAPVRLKMTYPVSERLKALSTGHMGVMGDVGALTRQVHESWPVQSNQIITQGVGLQLQREARPQDNPQATRLEGVQTAEDPAGPAWVWAHCLSPSWLTQPEYLPRPTMMGQHHSCSGGEQTVRPHGQVHTGESWRHRRQHEGG